jgi:hypothetical protein
MILLLLLLRFVLGLGGVAPGAMPPPAFGARAPVVVDPLSERIAELDAHNLLKEAREYIAGGRQMALTDAVNAWYAAGCKNVWFEVSRDINGRLSPRGVIVELPPDKVKDKDARAKCMEILRGYYDEHEFFYSDDELMDTGQKYVVVRIRG